MIPWTLACQAPLSMRFSRQKYWNGLPFPSPGNLPDPGIESGLLHCRQMIYQLRGKPNLLTSLHYLILPATSLSHTGPDTRKLGTGSMFQSPLKWFKPASSRPPDPASPIPSQGNCNRGYSFRPLPCPCLPYMLFHL